MHLFVIGATGVIGRATVSLLLRSGHTVTGLGRSAQSLLAIDSMGAGPVRGEILDGPAMLDLIRSVGPDAVINLATSIPLRLKIDPRDWVQNDRIRAEGTRNILRACEAAGVRLLVQESVGYVCSPRGSEYITEDSPRSTHPFLRATVEMEDVVATGPVPGVILRFAALMSPDSWHTRQMVAAFRRRMLPIVGSGNAFLSMIHAKDAAAAIAAVLEAPERAARKTYNVADNEPSLTSEVFRYSAKVLRAPEPLSVPRFAAQLAVGELTLEILGASYRMDNTRIRSDLGFVPEFPSFRDTWTQIATAVAGRDISLAEDMK